MTTASAPLAFSLFGACLLLVSVAAFWTPYLSHPLRIREVYLHAHVVAVGLWMSALIAQPLLIRARRYDLHRALGRASFALAPAVGLTALLLAHSRFNRMDEATLAKAGYTLYLPLMSITGFLASYALAIAFRRQRAAHAAFMLGTALSLIEPIVVRLIFFYTPAGEVHWIYDIIGIVLIAAILIGLIVRFEGAPGTRSALAVLLALFGMLSAGWFTVARTTAWAALARWLVDLPLT